MKSIVVLAICLSTAVLHGAPRWNGSGGWGPHGNLSRMYNPQTVKSIRGEVTAIEEMAPMNGMGPGIHLRIKSGEGTTSVHLGPSWYLLNQEVQIRKGDQIEVTGSEVTLQGTSAIIASTIRKNNETLELRDSQGVPLWAGWRSAPKP